MKPQIKTALQIAGATLVVSLALVGAKRIGLIDSDGFTRISMALVGLVVAWYGNITPKENPGLTARRLAYRRTVGYALAVAGLVNAAIWIWAPMAYAAELSMVPLLGALVVIFGYCFWLRADAAPGASA